MKTPAQKQKISPVKRAFNSGNKRQFQKLINQKGGNEQVDKQAFYPDTGPLTMWDLFHRLDPKQYQNKSFNSLTSYEKLYVELFERYLALELSHRLNVKGEIDLTYDKEKLEHVNLEGQATGFSVMQLKDHLLTFSASHHKQLSPGFYQALEKILEVEPRIDSIRNNQSINSLNVFMFNHVNHDWGALLTHNKLYMVNMGLGSDKKPGIHVFDVPKSKRSHLFNHLKALEKKNMVDDLAKGLTELAKDKDGELDYNKYSELFQQRYSKSMAFDHFKQLPKKFNLKETEYIHIPAQEAGNCSYYSKKGLFLALMYHFNQQHFHPKKAYQQSLQDFLQFIQYDYDHAISDYAAHALRPNTQLLQLAKYKLAQDTPLSKANAVKPEQYQRQVIRATKP